MASPTLTVGDTFPALRGAAKDEDGLMALPDAELVDLVVVGPDPFGGPVKVLDPPVDVGDPSSALGFNWEYQIEEGDIAAAGSYVPWLKVTWKPGSIEWVKGGDTINVQAAPE